MAMIGAPSWLFGDTYHPTFEPPIPQVQIGAPGFAGLGITRARWTAPPSGMGPSHDLSGLGLTRAHWAEPPHFSQNQAQLGGPLDFFDSGLWRNRKWLVLGGVALLGIAGLALAGAVLR